MLNTLVEEQNLMSINDATFNEEEARLERDVTLLKNEVN